MLDGLKSIFILVLGWLVHWLTVENGTIDSIEVCLLSIAYVTLFDFRGYHLFGEGDRFIL